MSGAQQVEAKVPQTLTELCSEIGKLEEEIRAKTADLKTAGEKAKVSAELCDLQAQLHDLQRMVLTDSELNRSTQAGGLSNVFMSRDMFLIEAKTAYGDNVASNLESAWSCVVQIRASGTLQRDIEREEKDGKKVTVKIETNESWFGTGWLLRRPGLFVTQGKK